MALVYVSLGSNVDRYRHIHSALDALSAAFGDLVISKVYESESIGFEGSHFLNLAVAFNCELTVAQLLKCLRGIEDLNGRLRGGPKFSSRTLDIDILTCDDLVGIVDGVKLPRDEIVNNAFVLLPMVDIAPEGAHPVLKKTYRQLWQDYDQASQKLWPVNFDWNQQRISTA